MKNKVNLSAEEIQLLDRTEKYYWKNTWRKIFKDWRLYLMLLPLLLVYLFWRYFPMYELINAFKKYNPSISLGDRDFVGLFWFKTLLVGDQAVKFWPAFRNTFLLSFYGLLFGFPVPIILALFFSEIKSNGYRSFLQISSYLPRFVSTVVVTSIIQLLLKRGNLSQNIEPGLISNFLVNLG
jgi:putative aldouronate transport system permease protein